MCGKAARRPCVKGHWQPDANISRTSQNEKRPAGGRASYAVMMRRSVRSGDALDVALAAMFGGGSYGFRLGGDARTDGFSVKLQDHFDQRVEVSGVATVATDERRIADETLLGCDVRSAFCADGYDPIFKVRGFLARGLIPVPVGGG